MLNIIRKTGLKPGLAILVLVLFTLTCANVAFAADNETISSSVDKNSGQMMSGKQLSKSSASHGQAAENNSLLKNTAASIWSMVTPDEVLAAMTLTVDCRAECDNWSDGKCIKWKDNASADCKSNYSK